MSSTLTLSTRQEGGSHCTVSALSPCAVSSAVPALGGSPGRETPAPAAALAHVGERKAPAPSDAEPCLLDWVALFSRA